LPPGSSTAVLGDVSPVGVFRTDARGRNVEINRCWSTITGLTLEETRRGGLKRLVHPDDRERIFRQWRRAVRAGKPFDGQYRIVSPDGKVRFILAQSIAERSAAGEVAGYVGILSDITELKLAEQERDSFFEISLDLLVVAGVDGTLLRGNSAWLRSLGRRPGELVAGKFQDLVHPEDRPLVGTELARLAGGLPSASFECRMRNKDGVERWFLWKVAAPAGEGQLFAIGRDVTERKWTDALLERNRADLEARIRERTADLESANRMLEREITERKLAEFERQTLLGRSEDQARMLDQILSASVDVISMYDRKGIVTYTNAAAARMIGKQREEIIGQDWRDLGIPAEFAEPFGRQLQHVFEGGTTLTSEASFPTTEGQRQFEYILSPIYDATRQVQAVLCSSREVTEARRTADMLRQTEKLAATGRLAAAIAHEINNPLAGIKNSLLLIRDAVPEDHPDRSYLARIEREIDRVARIVRQMFEIHRPEPEAGRRFVVDEVVHDVVALLQHRFREHDVAIALDVPEPEVVAVLPEGHIRQILFNLVENAIHASPRGGVVTISLTMDGDTLMLSVADQGEGIPVDIRSQIFEPFFSTKSERGLGLGLSISRGLVETLGGSLSFETTLGVGTVFRMTCPRNLETREASSA
jgi:hypothetical protein